MTRRFLKAILIAGFIAVGILALSVFSPATNQTAAISGSGASRDSDGRLRTADGFILPTAEECASVVADYDANGDGAMDALELNTVSNLWVEEGLPDNDNTYLNLLACATASDFEAGAAGAGDLDGDGITEDVNGDGSFTADDCETLRQQEPF